MSFQIRKLDTRQSFDSKYLIAICGVSEKKHKSEAERLNIWGLVEHSEGLVLLLPVSNQMDGNSNRFGRGPRELTGALDLVSHFKLLPHHEFFCKNSRPVSVLDTHYLCNVIGDTEIRKGEGMQLDQLVQATLSRDNAACIKPFNLDVLGEAFHLRESASVNLSPAEKGSPTIAVKSKSGTQANDKHKKSKDKHKEKDKESKKHKRSREEKEKKRDKHDKKKKRDRDDDTNGLKKHKKSKHKSSKIDDVGIKR